MIQTWGCWARTEVFYSLYYTAPSHSISLVKLARKFEPMPTFLLIMCIYESFVLWGVRTGQAKNWLISVRVHIKPGFPVNPRITDKAVGC